MRMPAIVREGFYGARFGRERRKGQRTKRGRRLRGFLAGVGTEAAALLAAPGAASAAGCVELDAGAGVLFLNEVIGPPRSLRAPLRCPQGEQ